MHSIDQALRDVQFLSRTMQASSPHASNTLRTVWQLAGGRAVDVCLPGAVSMDKAFLETFAWDPVLKQAGLQTYTLFQALELRHFARGMVCRLLDADNPHLSDAYHHLISEIDFAIQQLGVTA